MINFPTLYTGQMPSAGDWNKLTKVVSSLSSISARGLSVTFSQHGLTLSTGQSQLTFKEPAQIANAENIGTSILYPMDVAMITWPMQLQDSQSKRTGHSGDDSKPESFLGTRTLEITEPTDYHFGRFCVCAQKIEPGTVGMVYHSGVCLCNIARKHDVYKNGSRYPDRADTVKGETYLQLSEVGAAQVLWIYGAPNEVTEPVPAVIRFEARNTTAVGVWEDGNRDNRGLSEVLEFDDTVTIESIYPGVIKLDKNEGA